MSLAQTIIPESDCSSARVQLLTVFASLKESNHELYCVATSCVIVAPCRHRVDRHSATILKKANAQPNVAIFARFAPYGREQAQWFVKQALDIGLMGVIFNGIDNREQALLAVRNMRYPQQRNSKYPEPPGLRGYAPGGAVWWWGISEAEYVRRADLWPLNPDGDLLAIMMIETSEGLKNADAIASVPGVGAIFVGAGADLSQYLGVARNSAELEQGFQTILKACLAHNVACGITALNGSDIVKRLTEGWKMIRTTEAALLQWRASQTGR